MENVVTLATTSTSFLIAGRVQAWRQSSDMRYLWRTIEKVQCLFIPCETATFINVFAHLASSDSEYNSNATFS